MIGFPSLRLARSFVRGYCVPRVVAVRPAMRNPGERFVICHPDTAKRHGWKVVS